MRVVICRLVTHIRRLVTRRASNAWIEWTSAAAEYLHGRDWQGLEVRRGETEVHVAAAGRTGVASGYAEEPDAAG